MICPDFVSHLVRPASPGLELGAAVEKGVAFDPDGDPSTRLPVHASQREGWTTRAVVDAQAAMPEEQRAARPQGLNLLTRV
jgi:hypothetical protein